MQSHADPLERVVAELERRRGDLQRIAEACRIPYDTILRIKNRQNDPGYSKVRALHEHLFGQQLAKKRRQPAQEGAQMPCINSCDLCKAVAVPVVGGVDLGSTGTGGTAGICAACAKGTSDLPTTTEAANV